MKKKLTVVMLSVMMLVGAFAAGVYAATQYTLIIDNQKIDTDIIVQKGTSYVPLRVVSETLGADVKYDGPTKTITITSAEKHKNAYVVDGFSFYDIQVTEGIIGWEVVGEVKNVGEDIESGMFTITFYDANDKRIGTAVGSVGKLAAGESKTITFVTTDELDKFEHLKVQVDMKF